MNVATVGLSSPPSSWGWPASCASSTAIWAFRYHGVVPQHLEDAIFGTSRLKTYGWVYLVVGVLLILSALAVMSRSQIGIWIGVVFAALASISAIWWMPYYPIWSLTYVGAGRPRHLCTDRPWVRLGEDGRALR